MKKQIRLISLALALIFLSSLAPIPATGAEDTSEKQITSLFFESEEATMPISAPYDLPPLPSLRAIYSDGYVEMVESRLIDYTLSGTSVLYIERSFDRQGNLSRQYLNVKGVGTCVVTARYKGLTASMTVTITPAIVATSISFNHGSITMEAGETFLIDATVTYSDGTVLPADNNLSYTSADSSVVKVATGSARLGTVEAKKAGTAKITAKISGVTASIDITVVPTDSEVIPGLISPENVLRIEFHNPIDTLHINVFYTPYIKIFYKNGETRIMLAVVEHMLAEVGFLNFYGRSVEMRGSEIWGVSPGVTVVTYSYYGKTATMTITVPERAITKIAFADTVGVCAVGSDLYYPVNGWYSITSGIDVSDKCTYSSANTAVATVSDAGVVTGKSKGSTVITAVYGNMKATFTVNVSDATTKKAIKIEFAASSYRVLENNGTPVKLIATYSDGSTGDVTSKALCYASAVTSSIYRPNIGAPYSDVYNPYKSSFMVIDGVLICITDLPLDVVNFRETLYAHYEGLQAEVEVLYQPRKIMSISFPQDTLNLVVGEQKQIVFYVTYGDGTVVRNDEDRSIVDSIWCTSQNTSIAKTDIDGFVTAYKEGTTSILIKFFSDSFQINLPVVVGKGGKDDLVSISFAKPVVNLTNSETYQTTVIATYFDGRTEIINSGVEYKYNKYRYVFDVNDSGLVTAGTAFDGKTMTEDLTAVFKDKKAVCTIRVTVEGKDPIAIVASGLNGAPSGKKVFNYRFYGVADSLIDIRIRNFAASVVFANNVTSNDNPPGMTFSTGTPDVISIVDNKNGKFKFLKKDTMGEITVSYMGISETFYVNMEFYNMTADYINAPAEARTVFMGEQDDSYFLAVYAYVNTVDEIVSYKLTGEYPVTFTSSDPSVAYVKADGLKWKIVALKPGIVKIDVEYLGHKDKEGIRLMVVDREYPMGLSFPSTPNIIPVGSSLMPMVYAEYNSLSLVEFNPEMPIMPPIPKTELLDDSDDYTITSDNPSVLEAEKGAGFRYLFRGKKPGTANITVTYKGKSSSMLVTVVSKDEFLTGITTDRISINNLVVGKLTTIAATAHYANGENMSLALNGYMDFDVTFTSKDPEIASVDPKTGIVTAIKPGITSITVKYKNVTTTVMVTVIGNG